MIGRVCWGATATALLLPWGAWIAGCSGRQPLPLTPEPVSSPASEPWMEVETRPLVPEETGRLEQLLARHHATEARLVRGLTLVRTARPRAYLALYLYSTYAEWEARQRRAGTLDSAHRALRDALSLCTRQAPASRPAQREACEISAWPNESIARTGDRSGCLAFHVALVLESDQGQLTIAHGHQLEPAVCGDDPRASTSVQEMALRDLDGDRQVEVLVRYLALGPSSRLRGGTDFERFQILRLPEATAQLVTELTLSPPGEDRSWVARYQMVDRNGDGHDDVAVAGAEFTSFGEVDGDGWPVHRDGEGGPPAPARPGDEEDYDCVLWETDRLWLYDEARDGWVLQNASTPIRAYWGVER